MRRSLLIVLALLVLTWFEFQVYPGHSYLHGETQLLVPMLERLDTPGFLSRDLVAANPSFAYTIFDEFTQFIHSEGHLSFEQALLRQQLFFRFAAILGVFLCARGLKVAPLPAVILAAAVNAVTRLDAPAAFVTSPEATPVAFAFSLVLLAAGLLMNRSPLLGGLAGGVALLYHPMTAAAFWLVVIVASIADRTMRGLLHTMWPSLLIFALILGNFMQLQVGLGSGHELTARLSSGMVHLTQIRTPWLWFPHSLLPGILSYLFLIVAGAWALALFWKRTEPLARWVTIGLALSGLLSIAAARVLLAARVQLATEMPPASSLAFAVAMPVLVCGAAAAHQKKWLNKGLWAALVLAAILNAQLLDLWHGKVSLASRHASSLPEVTDLAAWAEQTTWGSSMFQFPDAGKQDEPGVFRALSRRSLWADWQSGLIADYSDKAGQEWWSRWQANMVRGYSIAGLQNMLPLPIDYYVLQREHALRGIKPAFSNSRFVVYDAQDLREFHGPLQPLSE
jgi:hypothetical protein